ncbi:MAG: acyltransferase [Chitinophagales bacterium]|nr:acyltransferase [Chitinophagales bacterium]
MPTKRIECLDSLRGIAAIAVILSHMNLEYFNGGMTMPLRNTPLHVFYDGDAAVVFFFVLSGFVLSFKYVGGGIESLSRLSLRSFFVARVFRILPMFWFVLIITALCALYFPNNCVTQPQRVWSSWWYQFTPTWVNFLKQVTLIYSDPFLGRWIGAIDGHPYIPQAWSLSIELILSLMVPVFALIAVNRPKWLMFLTVILVWIFGVYVYLIHFVMGILLALYLPQISHYINNKGKAFASGLLMTGVLLYSYRYSVVVYFPKVSVLQIILFSENSVYVVIGAGVVLIISCVLSSTRLQQLLNLWPVKLIGKVSYGIYLVHTLVMVFITPFFIRWLNDMGITGFLTVLIPAFIVTIATSIIIAVVLHYLVELPCIRLGKKLNMRINQTAGLGGNR